MKIADLILMRPFQTRNADEFLDECDTFAYKHYSTGSKTLWALRPSSAKNAGLLR